MARAPERIGAIISLVVSGFEPWPPAWQASALSIALILASLGPFSFIGRKLVASKSKARVLVRESDLLVENLDGHWKIDPVVVGILPPKKSRIFAELFRKVGVGPKLFKWKTFLTERSTFAAADEHHNHRDDEN